jgi:hypothetical protein
LLTDDGRLLVANAAIGHVSVFAVGEDALELRKTAPARLIRDFLSTAMSLVSREARDFGS